jgi:hypothetical protein
MPRSSSFEDWHFVRFERGAAPDFAATYCEILTSQVMAPETTRARLVTSSARTGRARRPRILNGE